MIFKFTNGHVTPTKRKTDFTIEIFYIFIIIHVFQLVYFNHIKRQTSGNLSFMTRKYEYVFLIYLISEDSLNATVYIKFPNSVS